MSTSTKQESTKEEVKEQQTDDPEETWTPRHRYKSWVEYQNPSNEKDLTEIINSYDTIRVHGSNHSLNSVINGPTNSDKNINIFLNNFNSVSIDKENSRVTVGGGCNLGKDQGLKLVSSGTFGRWKISLNKQLQKEGLALPTLGGITQQTTAGFLSTGSSGGELMEDYNLFDKIRSIKFIDGTGTTRTITKPEKDDDDNEYNGAIVSMGLLGVVTEYVIDVEPTYNIKGVNDTLFISYQANENHFQNQTLVRNWKDYWVDIYDQDSLEKFFTSNNYSRILIYPQPNVELIQIWHANRIEPTDDFIPKPFSNFKLFTSKYTETEEKTNLSKSTSNTDENEDEDDVEDRNIPDLVKKMLKFLEEHDRIREKFLEMVQAHLNEIVEGTIQVFASAFLFVTSVINPLPPDWVDFMAELYRNFTPIGYQEFQDYWYKGLPMDNSAKPYFLPFEFFELWFDISEAGAAMKIMQEYWSTGNNLWQKTRGNFVEIYTSTKNNQWLSPGYKRDSFRLDFLWYWWQGGPDKMEKTYQEIMDLFYKSDLNPRVHQGKWQPPGNVNVPDDENKTWYDYYSSNWPDKNYEKFRDLRKKYDPNGKFLNEYWKAQLNISTE